MRQFLAMWYYWEQVILLASVVAEGGIVSGLVRCEQPNRNIYEFTANMEFRGQRFPLSQSNIILRGCELKNTEWVIGVVVYTGQETKAMLNSAASPAKRSKLESHMNRETLWLSVFLLIMCSVVALGMGLWLQRHKEQLDMLPYYRKSRRDILQVEERKEKITNIDNGVGSVRAIILYDRRQAYV